jgi:hypothetical protein
MANGRAKQAQQRAAKYEVVRTIIRMRKAQRNPFPSINGAVEAVRSAIGASLGHDLMTNLLREEQFLPVNFEARSLIASSRNAQTSTARRLHEEVQDLRKEVSSLRAAFDSLMRDLGGK